MPEIEVEVIYACDKQVNMRMSVKDFSVKRPEVLASQDIGILRNCKIGYVNNGGLWTSIIL